MFERILIFGGTGSLGTMIIQLWMNKGEKFIVYSRDEYKQWTLKQRFPAVDISFVLGDVFDREKVMNTICNCNPTLIIVASAMKHVDRCELDVRTCMNTNCIGFLNIIETIQNNAGKLLLQKLIFVSTDKACNPINVYGMSKSICEHIVQNQKSLRNNKGENICFAVVRYGNVLNSNGSIIPMLQKQAMDNSVKYFTITDDKMTRFYMTLEDSVNLIEDCVNYSENGQIWIPVLDSMRIMDLFELFSQRYNKPIKIIGIRPGEKIHESLISEMESLRIFQKNNRFVIGSTNISNVCRDYSSKNNILNKSELYSRLENYLNWKNSVCIIVLGSNGMLGTYMTKYLGKFYKIIEVNRSVLNVTTENINRLSEYFKVEEKYNVVVINCMGITNKRYVSWNEFILVNGIFPKKMYEVCLKNNWKFIQPSTDCVFDGNKSIGQSYSETDKCDTKDVYGLSKLQGECGTVIRVSIIGKEKIGNGLYEVVCRSKNMEGYTNHIWNGITCLEYAKIVQQMIEKNIWWVGARHVVPGYTVSKYQLLQQIKNVNGLDLELIAKDTEQYVNRKLSTIYDQNWYINNLDCQLAELKDFEV